MIEATNTYVNPTAIACSHGLGWVYLHAKRQAASPLVEKIVDGLTYFVRPLVDSLRRHGSSRSAAECVNPMAGMTWGQLHDPCLYSNLRDKKEKFLLPGQ